MTAGPKEVEVSGNTDLGRQGGEILKKFREQAGFSQTDFAHRVGLSSKRFISQVEIGNARIPPGEVPLWAMALGMAPREFALLFEEDAGDLNTHLKVALEAQVVEEPRPKPEGLPELIAMFQRQMQDLTERVRALADKVETLAPQNAVNASSSTTRASQRRAASKPRSASRP